MPRPTPAPLKPGRVTLLPTVLSMAALAPLVTFMAPGRAIDAPPPLPPVSAPLRAPATAGTLPTKAVTSSAKQTGTSTTGMAGPLRPMSIPQGTVAVSSTRQIVLELGKRQISLIDGAQVLGSWPVAIGDPATPTPTGTFKVRNKVINPQYQSTKSGKNNPTIGPQGPLGDRWIGFHSTAKDQFGIHGTPSAWAWTVNSRAAVSHGCVRMLTPHVRALFEQVDVGTPVIVKN